MDICVVHVWHVESYVAFSLPPLMHSPLFSFSINASSSTPIQSPSHMADHFEFKLLCNCLNKVFMAVVTCTVALGGATIGTIAGTIKGPTTETGLLRGAAVGAVTGAITALQLMDMIINGEPFSKVSLINSLVNGQVFADWVSPAVLKAYQSQINGSETTFVDLFDVCENNGSKGMCEYSINELPRFVFENCCRSVCAICLQNFKNKEEGRELQKCKHVFHLTCIDEWLSRNGSCPVCRRNV